MALPCSFSGVSYFKDEYRGDLIITEGMLYYFPQERVEGGKIYLFGGPIDKVIVGIISPLQFLSGGANLKDLSDVVSNLWNFFRRGSLPVNEPHIKKIGLWSYGDTNQYLQRKLDSYIKQMKSTPSDFDAALPKPMRFAREEVRNVKFGWYLTFDTEFDNHDFGVTPFSRKALRQALQEGGFLD